MKRRSILICGETTGLRVEESKYPEKALAISILTNEPPSQLWMQLDQDELDELLDAIDTLRPARERKKK